MFFGSQWSGATRTTPSSQWQPEITVAAVDGKCRRKLGIHITGNWEDMIVRFHHHFVIISNFLYYVFNLQRKRFREPMMAITFRASVRILKMPARLDYGNHIHDCFSNHRRASEPLRRQRNFPFDRVGNVRLRTRCEELRQRKCNGTLTSNSAYLCPNYANAIVRLRFNSH